MDIPRKLGIKDSDFRLVIGSSSIDYDPKKNEKNIAKHGYSFDEAVEIFQHIIFPTSKIIPFIQKDSIINNDECRSNVITLDKTGNVILIALSMRQDETIRIISMRPAKKKERNIFTEHTGYNKSMSYNRK